MAVKIRFVPSDRATKDSLYHGIRQWVSNRLGREVRFSYLDKCTFEDLELLAMAMGYKPKGKPPAAVVVDLPKPSVNEEAA
jgi:hypothetical protein